MVEPTLYHGKDGRIFSDANGVGLFAGPAASVRFACCRHAAVVL